MMKPSKSTALLDYPSVKTTVLQPQNIRLTLNHQLKTYLNNKENQHPNLNKNSSTSFIGRQATQSSGN